MMIVFKSNYSNDYLVTQRGFQAVVTAGMLWHPIVQSWKQRFELLFTCLIKNLSLYVQLNR